MMLEHGQLKNRLLAALSPDELSAISPLFSLVGLRKRQVLQDRNRNLLNAFFVEEGAASMLSSTKRDGAVEVALVGRLGFVGVPILLGTRRSPHRCVVHVPGAAYQISAPDLVEALRRSDALRSILNRYLQALLVQQSQVSLCNARHKLEERLARWLLIVRDRIGSDEIPVTHDLMAQVLGVRRAGVTTAIGNFEETGAIARARGRIVIADPARLQGSSCECYAIISAEYERIFDRDDALAACPPAPRPMVRNRTDFLGPDIPPPGT